MLDPLQPRICDVCGRNMILVHTKLGRKLLNNVQIHQFRCVGCHHTSLITEDAPVVSRDSAIPPVAASSDLPSRVN